MQDLKKTTELNSINNRNYFFESSYLGLTEYQKSLGIQESLLKVSQRNGGIYLIGIEHPAVLTMGLRAKENEEIINSDLPTYYVSRGGLATIHSEGQLVIYPIMNLKKLGFGIRDYVTLLMKSTQDLLSEFEITSYIDDKNMGLYTENGKIAFCGIQVKSGITQHGLSLNVRNDLSLFSNIRACGMQDVKLDSLSAYGLDHTLSELYEQWVRVFKKNISSRNIL